LKEAIDQTATETHLSDLELSKAKTSHDLKMAEFQDEIQRLQEEISNAIEQTRGTKEQIHRIQN
jgi:hypothetical protein